MWSLTSARHGIRAREAPASRFHLLAMRLVAVGLVGVLGTLLAWITPFSPLAAGGLRKGG
jgi:hypothetical protein